ncbi:dehydrogenase [Mesorhizobium sp. L-8-10]|uniref:NAD(P)-dependent oxidoreductase n=1 Tax=Mesorhizobium sp. L-8-10 TaxID=2744523 RepID=UPI001927F322|nr:NAD(P)-dependent oxidoreductase [Mesorhizobium sp. L-8-10]BCH32239.1 dehydrogenase [Mesorhizobium sp. L-8-10]
MRKRAKILSTHTLHPRATAMLTGAGDLVVASALDPQTLIREASDVDIVIVRAPLPAALFAAATGLRAAIRHGAGLDMIPVEAATEAGVLVANVPGVNARSVAEHVFFVTLALLRRFRVMDTDLRGRGWLAGRAHSDHTNELAGRTMGIVGLGNVGRNVMRIARDGFGLRVAAASRSSPRDLPDDVTVLGIDELVAESDVLVLCCPLTPETTGLLDRDRIGRMKADALVVNVARGAVIEDAALIASLREGRIGGAALDVFATQPLPADHPYFSFPNVIVTPHMAGITEESMMRMGTGAAGEAIRVLSGRLPVNLRNPDALERYRRRFPSPA